MKATGAPLRVQPISARHCTRIIWLKNLEKSLILTAAINHYEKLTNVVEIVHFAVERVKPEEVVKLPCPDLQREGSPWLLFQL